MMFGIALANPASMNNIAEILISAETAMTKACAAAEPAFDALLRAYDLERRYGRYDPLNDVEAENRRKRLLAALSEVDDLRWRFTLELHNFRYESELEVARLLKEVLGHDEELYDAELFEQIESFRAVCRKFAQRIDTKAIDLKAQLNI